ncbi:MAG: hypothetical protein AAGJ37_14965 [Pseudomonadota bacterium]
MSNNIASIIDVLDDTQRMHAQVKAQGLTASIRGLQAWQTQRLLTTHDDLWRQKRFKPAMQFFIDEIYGPKDFSSRDVEIASVVPKMVKVLPDKAVAALYEALRLNSLSLELDIAMVGALKGRSIDRDSYLCAYQQCDNQDKRTEQIQLIETLGLRLAQVVQIRGVALILKLARKPARLAGVESLHNVLERGFHSFKELGNVHDFIDPIIDRERTLMTGMFSLPPEADNPLPEVVT